MQLFKWELHLMCKSRHRLAAQYYSNFKIKENEKSF